MPTISTNIQESNQDILNDIQSLQQIEQELFNSLETNPNLTSQQQENIVNKINQLTNMRINLYQTLSGVNGYFQNALKTSHGTLQDQSVAINIVEDELNQMKKQLKVLETEKNNKMRIVEINSYFGDKYSEHAALMKIIIFTLVPIIILTVINKIGVLPQIVYYVLLSVISAIGAYFFWYRWASIITRDPMNYNEYDWDFNPKSAPTTANNSQDPWLNVNIGDLSGLGDCVGPSCCSSGQTFDSSLNQCVTNNSNNRKMPPNLHAPAPATLENFATNVFTKTSHTNKYKHNNSLYHLLNSPQPSKPRSFIYNKNY